MDVVEAEILDDLMAVFPDLLGEFEGSAVAFRVAHHVFGGFVVVVS